MSMTPYRKARRDPKLVAKLFRQAFNRSKRRRLKAELEHLFTDPTRIPAPPTPMPFWTLARRNRLERAFKKATHRARR